jgi:hypothetical protein
MPISWEIVGWAMIMVRMASSVVFLKNLIN